ncbi:MAG: ABC transporter permease [Acidobacteriota bacterium]|nr:ABC transporter permease [Acidobacteriota bacterium]
MSRLQAMGKKTSDQTRWVQIYQKHESSIIGFSSVMFFLIAWESAVRFGWVNALFLAPPTDVAVSLIELSRGRLWEDVYVSGLEFVIGFVISVAFGIPFGLWVGWNKRAYYAFNPFLSGLYATPRIALLPLLIIWAGIGIWSKVLMVFLGAVFPIAMNTIAGVRSADQSLVRVARVFGASDLHVFRTVILPGSVPFLLTGLRLGVGRGILSVIVAEFYASVRGLGNLISLAGETFQTSTAFAGVVIVAFIGFLSSAFLERLESRFDRWRAPN